MYNVWTCKYTYIVHTYTYIVVLFYMYVVFIYVPSKVPCGVCHVYLVLYVLCNYDSALDTITQFVPSQTTQRPLLHWEVREQEALIYVDGLQK